MTRNSTGSKTKKVIKTKALVPSSIFQVEVYDSYTDRDYINSETLQKTAIGAQGVGGLGVHFATDIARMGYGHIEICDGDDVELKNLPIQFFYPSQIGENKALACIDNLKRECTGKTTLIAYPMYFTDAFEAYPKAFSKTQILASLVDNHKARYEAAEFGLKHKIPVIFTGVSVDMKVASVFIQKPGKACFNCFKNLYSERDKLVKQQCRHLAVLYPHTAIVSIAVYATTELAMGRKTPWNYFYLSFNGESINGYLEKNPNCEMCGGI